MIEVKKAVKLAMDAAVDFFDGTDLIELSLEEVEMTEDSEFWLITLGFYVLNRNITQNKIAIAFEGEKKYIRKYKVFKIDANNGEIVAMKIRKD